MTRPVVDAGELAGDSVGWKVTTVPPGRVSTLVLLNPLGIVTAPDVSLMTVCPRESVVVTMPDSEVGETGCKVVG